MRNAAENRVKHGGLPRAVRAAEGYGMRETMNTLADYEPLAYYTGTLRTSFEKNAADYFDTLVKRSGVNEQENAATVACYNAACVKAQHAEKKLKSCKVLRGFVIFFIVAALVAAAVLAVLYFMAEQPDWIFLLIAGICLLVGVILIVLLCTKLKQVLQTRQKKYDKAVSLAGSIKEQAMTQMRPLHALFTWNMTRELIQRSVPFLKLDETFDVKKLDLLRRKYGFGANNDPNTSTVFLLSGSVDGNPFLFERVYRCSMGKKTYYGSIVIHWTTYERDSDGNTRAVHHTQTLTASVTKPAPFYGYDTRLYYGNEAAPDLRFSRQPTHANELDEDEIEKTVKRGKKKLEKRARKAVGAGTQFTEMGNAEFDVLFGAVDRTNEVQFRLMFTPLAQQNMLELIKSDDGYGDDFAFYKTGCINCIRSEHAQHWQTDTDPARYKSHDLAAARAAFVEYNAAYFKSLYFDLAPVLSVPLYRQTKPREFIYRDVYPANYTGFEAEVLANRLGAAPFAHRAAKTDSILKASFVSKDGGADRVAVTANSYDTREHVEIVSVFGGDGRMHAVPVRWIEYIPVSNTREMALKAVGGTREGYEALRSGSALASFVRRYAPNGESAYCDGLIAFPLGGNGFGAKADAELSGIFGQRAAAAAGAAFLVGAEAVRAAADKLDAADDEARKRRAEQAAERANEAPAPSGKGADPAVQKTDPATDPAPAVQKTEAAGAAPAESVSEGNATAPEGERTDEPFAEYTENAADPFAEFDTNNEKKKEE